ncbi:MAG: metallophosphoesterase family protein [Candidatus Babeliales bacterium]|nr:metallophosphoesterase family protein [Candidatus Babeliales bacterium]
MKNSMKKIVTIALAFSLISGPVHAITWSDFVGAKWQSCMTAIAPKTTTGKVVATIAAVSALGLLSYNVLKRWNKAKEIKKYSYSIDDYKSWKDDCSKLPANINTKSENKYRHTALNWQKFEPVLNTFFAVNQQWYLEKNNHWLADAPKDDNEFYDITHSPFKPFVQKMVVAPGTTVAIRGDLHGDIHSLLAYIDFLQQKGYMHGFTITKKDFHILFLGDYVDRGNYGAEVLYTLMLLKIVNPDNVTMVRGNHEDIGMNADPKYAFKDECKAKFSQHDHALEHVEKSAAQSIAASFMPASVSASLDNEFEARFKKIARLYDFLPAALYLGSGNAQGKDFMQCCHGGMEVGFDPVALLDTKSDIAFSWITSLNQVDEYKQLHLPKCSAVQNLKNFKPYFWAQIGFMWNDYLVDALGDFLFDPKRGFIYNKKVTAAILNRASRSHHKVKGVLRAHQHSSSNTPMMESILDPKTNHQGVSKLWKDNAHSCQHDLWDGIVCTFLVAPDSKHYNPNGTRFEFDAFALMTTANTFDKWQFKVHRNMLKDILPHDGSRSSVNLKSKL